VTGFLSHNWMVAICLRGVAPAVRAVEEKIAVGVHTPKSKLGPGRNSGRCRENAELEERNSDSLVVRTSLARTGCSAGRDSQRIGRLERTHSLKRTGADLIWAN